MLELVFLSKLGICIRCVLEPVVRDHDLWDAMSCKDALCVHYDLFSSWLVQSGNFNVLGIVVHNEEVGVFFPFKKVSSNLLPG